MKRAKLKAMRDAIEDMLESGEWFIDGGGGDDGYNAGVFNTTHKIVGMLDTLLYKDKLPWEE